jgi:hypothetical protein
VNDTRVAGFRSASSCVAYGPETAKTLLLLEEVTSPYQLRVFIAPGLVMPAGCWTDSCVVRRASPTNARDVYVSVLGRGNAGRGAASLATRHPGRAPSRHPRSGSWNSSARLHTTPRSRSRLRQTLGLRTRAPAPNRSGSPSSASPRQRPVDMAHASGRIIEMWRTCSIRWQHSSSLRSCSPPTGGRRS